MEGPWEVRQGGEQGELLADHKYDDKDSGKTVIYVIVLYCIVY